MAGIRFALAGAAALALAACDNGPSAVQQQAAAAQMATGVGAPAVAAAGSAEGDRRSDPVRLVDGRPMWSASRRYSAEENARRAFERNGAAFGAGSLDDFVSKAHAFVNDPPAGVQTLTRANGDRLLYDPAGNVFAVATSAGAPRTIFKPDDGAAYWEGVKATEGRRRAARAPADEEA